MNSIGHRSCEIIMEEKHPCQTNLCVFRCLISRPQNWLISRKLRFFRGSSFSQCFNLFYQQLSIACDFFFIMPVIILSNYYCCPVPLNSDSHEWKKLRKCSFSKTTFSCIAILISLFYREPALHQLVDNDLVNFLWNLRLFYHVLFTRSFPFWILCANWQNYLVVTLWTGTFWWFVLLSCPTCLAVIGVHY